MKKTLLNTLSAAMIAAFVTLSCAAIADTANPPAKPAATTPAPAPAKKADTTKKIDKKGVKKDDKKPAAPAPAAAK